MGNKYYKEKALGLLTGNWGRELGYYMVVFVISFVLNFVQEKMFDQGSFNYLLATIVISLVTIPLSAGYTRHLMNIARGKDPEGISELFYYFSSNETPGIILLSFAVGIFTFLWTLLLIIPGIIAGIAYTLSVYIKIDNPEKGVIDTINESTKLMYGHKAEFFGLVISFIGWLILGTITVIGIIPVSIYIALTSVVYYNELINRKISLDKTEVNQEI